MCAKDFVGRMDWQIQRGAEAQAGAKISLAKAEISSPLSFASKQIPLDPMA